MEKYKQATTAAAAQRLQAKFRPKTYFEAYRTVFHVIYGASFMFNVLSAATASALVYFFLAGIMPPAGAIVATGAVLVALEATKRLTASRLFISHVTGKGVDVLAVLIVALLSGASIASSYKGAERVVMEYTPPAPTTDRADLEALNAQIATIDAQIKTQQLNTWRGKLTVPAARTIEKLTRQREKVQEAALSERARISDTDTEKASAHKAQTLSNAALFGLFTLACELLFFLAAYWLEYYDYRSYVELGAGAGAGAIAPPGALPTNPVLNKSEAPPARIMATPGRICTHCGTGYEPRHNKQRFCTDKCRLGAWQAKNGRPVARNNAG
jgi:hypothetical protein